MVLKCILHRLNHSRFLISGTQGSLYKVWFVYARCDLNATIAPSFDHSWMPNFDNRCLSTIGGGKYLFGQYHGCWSAGDARSKSISSYGIVPFLLEYSNPSNGGVSFNLFFYFQCVESRFLEIDENSINSTRNVIIRVIYRPPNSDTDVFIPQLRGLLDTIRKDNKSCYLLGDYNINLFNVDKHQPTAECVESLFSQ